MLIMSSRRRPRVPAGRRARAALLLLGLLAGLVTTGGPATARAAAPAASPTPSPAVGQPAGGPALDGLGPFLDSVLTRQLEERGVPGAAVAVVSGGRTVFTGGYGVADVERGTPVDPERTLFRTGSVGKLFTWTAVMQLVEQGRLELDRDVNDYLDLTVPDTHPGRPVTLQHLLTHTAGFEEQNIGLYARDAPDVQRLGDYLRDRMPLQVRPPGEVTSYSNYGSALAGHVVALVSGMDYDTYLEEEVFAPLGMSRTSSRQPPAGGLADDLATGHAFDGTSTVAPVEYFNPTPAGSHSATATDMARFMLAHLAAARGGSGGILQPDTARRMHARQFTAHPDLPGMAHGFYEQVRNGQRLIAHAGNTRYFQTNLVLVPEQDLGIYVAYNGTGDPSGPPRVPLRDELLRAFLDRVLPAGPPAPAARTEGVDSARFAGDYLTTRSTSGTIEKIGTLRQVSVAAGPDGTLRTPPGSLGSDPALATTWEPIGPLLYREVGGQELLGFREDERGAVEHLFVGGLPIFTWQALPWWRAASLHLFLAGAAAAVLVAALLVWPLGAAVSRRRAGRPPLPPAARRARRIAWASCAVGAAFLVGVVAFLLTYEESVVFGVGPLVRVVTSAGVVLVVASVVLVVATVDVWRRRLWTVPGRLGYTLVTLAVLDVAVLAGYYNLVGLPLGAG
jgi:CubicO group peptidase (beta-lactamase class C family)